MSSYFREKTNRFCVKDGVSFKLTKITSQTFKANYLYIDSLRIYIYGEWISSFNSYGNAVKYWDTRKDIIFNNTQDNWFLGYKIKGLIYTNHILNRIEPGTSIRKIHNMHLCEYKAYYLDKMKKDHNMDKIIDLINSTDLYIRQIGNETINQLVQPKYQVK